MRRPGTALPGLRASPRADREGGPILNIAWYSNSPHTPTGYGTQTKQAIRRLKRAGHHVTVLANFGDVAGIHDAGFLCQDPDLEGIAVWSQGHAQYSLDVIEEQAAIFFAGRGEGWVVTLYDVWVLRDLWARQRVASWTPVDHDPVTPDVLTWARKHRTIAMSRFGQEAFADAGVRADYVPHALEAVWRPTTSDVRERMRVPADAFLVTINAANIGAFPPRKAWAENLAAFAAFARDHPDAILYLHTDPVRPGGVNLPELIAALGIRNEQLRKTDLLGYRNGLIGQEELAKVYTASDVLLASSMGEGFGLPTIEAMACGTPAIVTDFAASPELVAETGWLVGFQPWWDQAQRSFFAMPSIPSIRDALEAAYEERGTQAAEVRSTAAIARAGEYEADAVFETYWRPLLAEMEDDLRPRVKRQKAKRR